MKSSTEYCWEVSPNIVCWSFVMYQQKFRWWLNIPSAAIFDKISPAILYYSDVIMSVMASQITSVLIVYSTAFSGEDQGKHQGSTSPAFVRGIHRWPVNSMHKGPITRKIFPFDDIIMWMMPPAQKILLIRESHSSLDWNINTTGLEIP